MNKQQLLTIIIPIPLKNTLIDVLIAYQDISGFTMTKVAGFSRQHSRYNVQEQVVGYRNFYRLEVTLNNTQVKPLLHYLCQFKGHYSLRYWVLPLADTGVIERESDCELLTGENTHEQID